MTEDELYSRNYVVAMPGGNENNWELYIVFQKNLSVYLYCCINQNSWSFNRKEFSADLIDKYEYVIYFEDNCHKSTKDEYIWYHLCNSQDFSRLLKENNKINFCIAVKKFYATSNSLYRKKLVSGKWKRAVIPPHVVYGRNLRNNKYAAFTKYCASSSPAAIRDLSRHVALVKYMPPLVIRFHVEVHFKIRPSFKATLFEREEVARLEMRVQGKFLGKILGLMLFMNKVAKIFRLKIHSETIHPIFRYLFKKMGEVTKLEDVYNEFLQECAVHYFDPLNAAHLYFQMFPEMRGHNKDIIFYKVDVDLFDPCDFDDAELEITDRYEVFLQLVRQQTITESEA